MVELWEHKSGKAIKAHVISVQVNGQVYRLSAPKSASPAIATTAKRRQKPAGVTAAAVSGSESVKQCLVLKVFLLLPTAGAAAGPAVTAWQQQQQQHWGPN
jgi:hypothetical protein